MAFDLQSVLKALLFSSGQPLSVKDIQAVLSRYKEQNKPKSSTESDETNGDRDADAAPSAGAGEDQPEVDALDPIDEDVPDLITAAQVREALAAIESELRNANDVYLLVEGAQGHRIVCNPRFSRWVRALRNEPPPAKLSQSALETLAVVSYRQPVTRSEIEAVRGVSADAGLFEGASGHLAVEEPLRIQAVQFPWGTPQHVGVTPTLLHRSTSQNCPTRSCPKLRCRSSSTSWKPSAS